MISNWTERRRGWEMMATDGLKRHLRLATLVSALMTLTACGFEPLMSQASHPRVQAEMERIRIAHIPERSGQILRNYLLDAMTPRGVQSPELYSLVITLNEPRREVAIRRDDTASRLSYAASATFALHDRQRRNVFSGSAFTETTYEVTNSEFATLSGYASARDRSLQDVSNDIRLQIATYLSGKAPPAPER